MPAITGSVEDREQIRELYARYALYIDAGKFEEWVNCFTEDGIFESPSLGKHAGHAALRKFCASYQESWAGAQVRHMMVNVSFDVHGDHAHGTCNLDLLPHQGRQDRVGRGRRLSRRTAQGRRRLAIRASQSLRRQITLRRHMFTSADNVSGARRGGSLRLSALSRSRGNGERTRTGPETGERNSISARWSQKRPSASASSGGPP